MIVTTSHVTDVVVRTGLSNNDEHSYFAVQYYCTSYWLQWQSTNCTQFNKKENQFKMYIA